jgi:hypothetical protein
MDVLIVFGACLLALIVIRAIVGMTGIGRRCDLCGATRDPSSKNASTWKYGIRACETCAAKLDEKYGDEWPPPPTPPL